MQVAADNPFAYAFASDNTAPATPEAMAALLAANAYAQLPSYGTDAQITRQAQDAVSTLFERDCAVFFVFSGTAANALAIGALRKPWESVFCTGESHLEKDETAAPEFYAQGLKLHLTATQRGDKLSIPAMRTVLAGNRGVHSAQPRVLSITQSTELGTLYSPSELDQLAQFAREHRLRIHMDGARFANAVVASGLSPAALTWQKGVDILCFGGTKNGTGLSEAVVIFDPAIAAEFGWRRKQGGQLASKMRLLAAPWLGALQGEHWLRRARAANAAAAELARQFQQLGLRLAFPREVNGVFVHLPAVAAAALEADGWHVYKFFEPDVYRFMCAWNTSEEALAALCTALERALERVSG